MSPQELSEAPGFSDRVVLSSIDAEPIDDARDYVGRPSVSPALAALVAAGEVRREHRVLDVGCGRGGDLVALGELGFRDLVGLDYNRASIRAARALEKRRLGRTFVDWRWGNTSVLSELPAARFDWALDTFLLNNLPVEDEREYLRRVARVLKRGGRFLVQWKVLPRVFRREPEGPSSPEFRSGPAVLTHYAEGKRRGERSHQSVAVVVLTRR